MENQANILQHWIEITTFWRRWKTTLEGIGNQQDKEHKAHCNKRNHRQCAISKQAVNFTRKKAKDRRPERECGKPKEH